jgi:signal peptidase I
VPRAWRAAVLVLLLVVVAAVHGGAVRVVRVASSSMAPTLCPGDRLLVWGWAAGALAQRDSVVTLRQPGTSQLVVKRVVAVAGETVEIVDGRLVVGGEPVEEDFLDPESVDGTFYGPVRVGPGEVFVMGDSREHSIDSRDFGALPRGALAGVVVQVGTGSSGACRGSSRDVDPKSGYRIRNRGLQR